jgi:hypothetical protein
MANHSEVPAWLLNELFLTDGVFNHDRTTVIGRPNAHLNAVVNTGQGAVPATVPIDLTKRADWEAIKTRLTDEGI